MKNKFENLKKFESVNKKLQEADIDLLIAKTLFEGLKSDFQHHGLDNYLGESGICSYPKFESAIANSIDGKTLCEDEKRKIQQLANRDIAIEVHGPCASMPTKSWTAKGEN